MTTKAIGSNGIEFPDATVQGSAAYSKAESDAGGFLTAVRPAGGSLSVDGTDPIDQFSGTAIDGVLGANGGSFTPSVPGYYQVIFIIFVDGSGIMYLQAGVSKNGSPVQVVTAAPYSGNVAASCMVTHTVYCNGTTDYVGATGRVNVGANIGQCSLQVVKVRNQ